MHQHQQVLTMETVSAPRAHQHNVHSVQTLALCPAAIAVASRSRKKEKYKLIRLPYIIVIFLFFLFLFLLSIFFGRRMGVQ